MWQLPHRNSVCIDCASPPPIDNSVAAPSSLRATHLFRRRVALSIRQPRTRPIWYAGIVGDDEDIGEGRKIERAIARDARLSFVFGVSGFGVISVGGCMTLGRSTTLPIWASSIGFALQTAGTVLLIIGLAFYARKKGRSIVLGGLGLLSWIGIVALAAMPKICRRCCAKVSARAKTCGECGTPA